jgi:predicted dienelactone hydrolase
MDFCEQEITGELSPIGIRINAHENCTVVLLRVVEVGLRIGFAATTFKVGESSRVFKASHARNWRGAKTEALVTTIWYPVSVDAKGVVEQPQSMGTPMPIFEAGSAAVDAPLATVPSKFPLVMLSHGTGGSAMQMAWLGTVLAQHGYIAVAVNHPGEQRPGAVYGRGLCVVVGESDGYQ